MNNLKYYRVFSRKKTYMMLTMVLVFLTGCKKFIEVDSPISFVTNESAFSSNQTAIAELNGLYTLMSQRFTTNGGAISIAGGLGADEMKMVEVTSFTQYYNFQLCYFNELNSQSTFSLDIWRESYNLIFQANTILEGLDKSVTSDKDPLSKLSPAVKKQLMGEAKFARAFIYFYLANCFGDVPLITTTDYKVNNLMPRTHRNLLYAQMERDLLDAQGLLNINYVNPDVITVSATSERTRPIKSTAAALLSRVYLYMGNRYAEAEVQASSVIDNAVLYNLTNLEGTFLKNSKETIWSLQPVNAGYQSIFGQMLLLPVSGPNADNKLFYLNEDLVGSFEVGDPRLTSWINSVTVGVDKYYYPYKYKKGLEYDPMITPASQTQNIQEYNVVLRLAEQYLIRAEARARNNNLSGAIADINVIRTRARNGAAATVLPNLPSTLNQTQIFDAISRERRHELFSEWGDRWFDLRRTGRLDAVMTVMTPIKSGKDWNPDQAWYPISQTVLRNNPNLTQNKGY